MRSPCSRYLNIEVAAGVATGAGREAEDVDEQAEDAHGVDGDPPSTDGSTVFPAQPGHEGRDDGLDEAWDGVAEVGLGDVWDDCAEEGLENAWVVDGDPSTDGSTARRAREGRSVSVA